MGLTKISTDGVKDDAVTTDKLANAINTERTANTAKVSLAADSVTGAKIADDAIDSEHITDGSIDTAHIADEAVTLSKLPHGDANNNGKFLRANNGADPTFETISTTPADGSITTAKIDDNAVNMNKLSDLDNGRIIARVSSGAGNPEAATDAQVRSLLNISGGLQVLEQFFSPADGSAFSTSNGTITLGNVTSTLNLTTTFQDLPGSYITGYTPPSGTTQVIYEVQFGLRSSDSNAILGGHMVLDGNIISESRFGLRGGQNYSDMLYHFKFGINIGGSTSTTTGRLASWTSGKEIKLQLDEHNSSFEWIANILGNYGAAGHQGAAMRPRIGITAIGAY